MTTAKKIATFKDTALDRQIQEIINNQYTDTGAEGTFTPTIIGSTKPGVQTYTYQIGWYRAVGDIVFFMLRVRTSSLDGAIAGIVRIGGLPYPAKTLTNSISSLSIGLFSGVTLGAGFTQLGANIPSADPYITVSQMGSAIATVNLPVTQIAAATEIRISGFYFI